MRYNDYGHGFSKDPVRLEDLIIRSLTNGYLSLLTRYLRIYEIWPRIVGEDDAKLAEPYLFEEGVLFVRVKHSGYLHKFNYQIPKWLDRLYVEFEAPVVEKIVLRLNPQTSNNA
ncbi:MAG: DUF721 domain-containing protein [Deltaproteobacteria bacterium]|nr:DUF721 domain-containing protein [Deltaproteobacteria bacterium]